MFHNKGNAAISMPKYRACFSLLLVISVGLIFSLVFYQSYWKTEPDDKSALHITTKEIDNTEEYSERVQRLLNVCKLLSTYYSIDYRGTNGTFFVDDRRNLLMCLIPKAGSTYYKHAVLAEHRKSLTYYSAEERSSIFKNYLKVMAVRHPYDRLWSAYNDKFIRPDSNHEGRARSIIEKYRKDADSISLRCGHKTTFEEFLQYVVNGVENGTLNNPHFVPYYQLCHPCGIKYDIIVKLESAATDMAYLSSKVTIQPLSNEILKTRWVFAAICAFRVREQANDSCLTPEVRLATYWRAWKSAGIISQSTPPPSLPFEVRANIHSHKHWRKFCYNVIEEQLVSAGDYETYLSIMKSQRNTLKLEAFKNLRKETKEKLDKIFALDMDLFGYEK